MTDLLGSRPPDGTEGIGLDRFIRLVFSGPIDPDTVGPQSIAVYAGRTLVETEYTLSLNRTRITLDFPTLLPGNAGVMVVIDGNQLLDRLGNLVDVDGDGQAGGLKTLEMTTMPSIVPPVTTGTAMILGRVFDENGAPLSGATIDAVYFGSPEGTPPLPAPPAISNFDGNFIYETVEFTGTESFLVRIRLDGYSEALRQADVEAERCTSVPDASLQPLTPKTMVMAAQGAELTDLSGQARLIIPAGALKEDSEIGVTILQSADFLRDALPPLVAEQGVFVDIAGVFGDETLMPVTLRVPNSFNLPIGTRVPFGKIDHNTLEWSDLREIYGGGGSAPDSFLGTVVNDARLGTAVEVQFDHFCTVCTGYCLPYPEPEGQDESGNSEAGQCGDSVVTFKDGHLREEYPLPFVTEYGERAGPVFAYSSETASPNVTLSARVDYDSTRPVEATVVNFRIEGLTREVVYGPTADDETPLATWIWNGRDALAACVESPHPRN